MIRLNQQCEYTHTRCVLQIFNQRESNTDTKKRTFTHFLFEVHIVQMGETASGRSRDCVARAEHGPIYSRRPPTHSVKMDVYRINKWSTCWSITAESAFWINTDGTHKISLKLDAPLTVKYCDSNRLCHSQLTKELVCPCAATLAQSYTRRKQTFAKLVSNRTYMKWAI